MNWQFGYQLDNVIAGGIYLFLVALIIAFVCGTAIFWFKLITKLNRRITPYFYEALRLYPSPKHPRVLSGWQWGYLRDKWFSRCRVRACEEGILVSRGSTWSRRPQILVPWKALSNPEEVLMPRFAFLLGMGANFIDMRVEGLPLNIVVGDDLWRFNPDVGDKPGTTTAAPNM